MSSPFLYPNVTSVPGSGQVGGASGTKADKGIVKGEFDQVFDRTIQSGGGVGADGLSQLKAPLKFSAHATQRMQDRKIQFDAATMGRIGDAIDRAHAKGLEDTLILSGDAALIVNVPNRTVVTAMDRESMKGNVFTNIDGAILI